MISQLEALTREIKDLRLENAELRRQLDAARGVVQHQPYALPVLPAPVFSPIHPLPGQRVRAAGDLSPSADHVDSGGGADVVMSSPPDDKDSKRPRRSLATALDAASGAPSDP